MRRKIIAIVLLLCLVAAISRTAGSAPGSAASSGTVFFIAVNNDVKPLSDETMPRYLDGILYIPYTFFFYNELGVYFTQGSDRVMLYSSGTGVKRLTFDLTRSTVFDQDQNQYYTSAREADGRIYVPVDEVCRFFGILYTPIMADQAPAPVLRFMKGATSINNPTFIGLNLEKMKGYYAAYIGSPSNPGTSPTPSSSPGTVTTYESVSIFPSFYALSPNNFRTVLDALDTYRYKVCFFISADEIAGDAELLRRAAGAGHSIGIWLRDGTLDEYQRASTGLFEAAKIKTILVSAYGDNAEAAEAMATAKGLVFWRPTRTYDEAAKISYATVTSKLNVLLGSRESINMACTDKSTAIFGNLLSYLAEKQYSVQRLTETTAPTYTIG